MASANVLAVALSDDDISVLSPDTRQKLEGLFNSKEESLTSLKTQLEKLKVNSEQRFQQLETEWIKTSTQLEKESSDAAELKVSKTKLEEQLQETKDELADLKKRSDGSFGTHQGLTRANEQLVSEKQEMVAIIERKSKEIQRLNDEWKTMSEKLAAADMAKAEVQMKLDELEHEDLSGKFREKRFEQEKEMLSSQIDWLDKSLKEKTEELLSLKKEKSKQILELQNDLGSQDDEIKQLKERLERTEKTLGDQTKKMEETTEKLKESLDVISRNEEQFSKELEAQKKLAEIYKQSSDEHEGRVRELISAVEELQDLLKSATGAQEELEINNKKMEVDHSAEKEELVKKVNKLEQELDNANDLLAAARKKGLTPLSEEELTSLSPTAAAASSFIKSGMTLTQMYSEYVKASESLQSEKLENQRLNEYMDQILQEIEEKAPILQQQREDYEKSLETTNQLSVRLDAALLELEQQRVTADEAERRRGHLMRENQRLKQQTVDLGQQVRVLLREVQEVRGGPIITSGELEPGVSSSDVTSSSQVIDQHLVTFKNIEELQKQNADLLNVVRELSEKREAEEKETLESKTSELKSKLDSAMEELEEMRDARRRQMEMVESVVRQRDMYRVLLAQSGGSPPPLSVSLLQKSPASVALSPGTPSPANRSQPERQQTPEKIQDTVTVNQEDKDKALEALQGEFETYRKEKAENERMLSEQLDTMRKDLSDFRVQNAKLSSQLEFASERFKILQTTAESYKSEVLATREKNQKLSSDLVKVQQSVSSLSEDLLAAQEKSNKLQIECQNARKEKELLKQVELRLSNENESLRNEQRNQNLLLTNLQQIQTNLERSDFETKSRLTNQLSSMERELNVMRRKLDGEGEQHRTVLKTWESKVRELERQLANELESHQKTKDELTKTKVDLQAMKQQCSSVEAQLVASQIKLQSANKELKDLESVKDSVDGGQSELELRALKQQLTEKEKHIQELTDKVGKAEQHVEQYKTISEAVEQSLKEQNEASQTFKDTMEKRLQESTAALANLESKLAESEKERDQLRSENQGLGDAANAQTAELRKNIDLLQERLKEATTKCSEAESRETAARHDCQEQSKVAKEACDKYEREVVLHAADVQQLLTVKEQMTNHNQKLSEAEELAKKAQDELTANTASWEEQLRVQKEQVKSIQNRCDELEGQNSMLHQQLEALSTQIIDSQKAASGGQTSVLNLSFSEENKSSEQLLEVIKFLRRDKEIAETRMEVTQGESLRLKQKSESMKRQVSELQTALQEERGRVEAMAQTAAQHELLQKKLETMNALTESNRRLREEKDKLEVDYQQSKVKVQQLEKDKLPLQQQVRENIAKVETLTAEKTVLAAEASSWRLRANQLLEKYNKVDPDEQEKLQKEKESNKKTISDLREEVLRYKTELSKLNGLLNNARTEISKLNMAQSSTLSKHNLEVQKLREELNIVKADLKSKTEEVTAKTADIEEKTKISNQVKRLGRKYKSQFEEAKAEVDRLQARLTNQEAEAAKPNPETEAKIKELEDKLQHSTQEIATLKQTEESLKSQVTEKEERHEKQRRVLQSAKQKITQLSGDKEKHLSEQERLQKELSEMQAVKMQMERKMEAQKQEYQARISALEREVKDVKADRDKIRAERVQEQLVRESQIDQMEGHPSSLLMTPDRASSSREEPPPTANIKPLSSPASAVGTAKGIPVSSGPKATASIRPIAVTPSTSSGVSSSTSTRMATVMPHTIEQPTQVNVPDDHEVQTSEPPSMTIVSATPIQAVTPTQQTPPIGRTEPISQQEPEPYIDDTPISGPSTSSEPSSSSSAGPPPNIPSSGKRQRDEPTESDQSSSTERDTLPPTEKRQRVTPQPIARVQAQEEPPIPHVMREAERATVAEVLPERSDRDQATASVQPEQVEVVMGSLSSEHVERIVGTVQGERVEPVAPSSQADTPQASQSSSDDHHKQSDRSTEPQSTGPPEKMEHSDERLEDEKPTPSSQDGTEEDVILVEDSDGEGGGGRKLPGEVESDADKEVSDYDDEEEGDDLGEAFEEGHYEGEEGTDYSDEEDMEEQEDLGDEEMGAMEGESPVTSAEEMEGTGREVVEIIDEEEEEHGEASQIGSDSPGMMDQHDQEGVTQSSSRGQGPTPPQLVVEPPEHSAQQADGTHSAPPPVVITGVPRPRERLPSTGRHLPAFSFAAFDDVADDCQVPSTPTLFVPHRNDGFAEAINSPLVQPGHQRFQFSAPEGTETRAPGLAQLASQGDLGVDDTLIYLPGGEDEAGSSRSVPTTPIQTLAPVSVAEASPSLAEAIPRPESTVTPSGADGVQTSSAVRPSSRGTDDAGISQQRSSSSPSPPTSSEQVTQAQLSGLTSSGRSKDDEDRSTVSGSEDISTETAATGNRPETSGTQPNSGNAQPSSSGDGETKKPIKRIVWNDGPSTTQQMVQPQSSSQETVRPTPRLQTAVRGGRGRLIQRTFPGRARSKGPRFPRGGRGGAS